MLTGMTNNERAGDSSPHTYMATPSRPSGLAGKVQLRAGTPEAVLAVVPHMLGFYPSRSLVVLGLGERSRVVVTFRYDLPDSLDYDLATDIAQHADYVLGRERIKAALLVGYGPAELVAGVAAITSARLAASGVDVSEVLRADGGRFWSLLCADVRCCPEEGRSYDPGSHPAAAALTEAGLTAHPDRDALARTIQPPAGSADRVWCATIQARLRLAQLVDLGKAEGDRDPRLRATRTGRREIQRAIRRYRSGGSIASVEQLAWLAVLLADIRVRDDAWARMDPAHRDAHCRLWIDVLRCADFEFRPAPASLLAFTAWQSGNGAMAAMAVERALAADPDYSMAQLLAGAVDAVLPPSAARMPMSPAAVAASYAPVPAEVPAGTPSSSRSSRSQLPTGSGRTTTPRRQPSRTASRARRRQSGPARRSGGGSGQARARTGASTDRLERAASAGDLTGSAG
jgi:hypothetical protein